MLPEKAIHRIKGFAAASICAHPNPLDVLQRDSLITAVHYAIDQACKDMSEYLSEQKLKYGGSHARKGKEV